MKHRDANLMAVIVGLMLWTTMASIAIVGGAPGTARADLLVYWSDRPGHHLMETNVTTNTTTILESTMGPGDPDSLIFDTQGNIIYGLTNAGWNFPYAEIRSFNPTTNTDSLITPQTGSFSTDLRDLVLDPSGTSVLVSDVQTRRVVRVDLSTGTRTVLKSFSSAPSGLAYDNAGNLFVAVYDQIYQLNPITGVIMNSSSHFGAYLDGLTFDPYSNMLYAAYNNAYLLSLTTDFATSNFVGSFGFNANLDGVQSDGQGNIIIADIGSNVLTGQYGKVWQYNIASNTTTFLFAAPGVDDIAPIVGLGSPPPSSPVPEPATMFLLGSGLVGLAGIRRKLKK